MNNKSEMQKQTSPYQQGKDLFTTGIDPRSVRYTPGTKNYEDFANGFCNAMELGRNTKLAKTIRQTQNLEEAY